MSRVWPIGSGAHPCLYYRSAVFSAVFLHALDFEPLLGIVLRLVYTIPSTKRIKFGKSIDQVFDLEEDTEMQQFASNCSAFASPAEDILEAAKKHNSYERFIPHVSTDLQGMDPHLYAQNLSRLLGNGAISVADFKTHFKPSEEWKHEDYELLPLALRPVTRSTLSLVPRHGNVAKVTKKSWRSLS